VLDLVMCGRADQVLDFDDPVAPNGSLAAPSAPFGQLLAAAFDEAITASSLCAAALTVGFRLDPVTRSPLPERQLSQLPAVRRSQSRLTATPATPSVRQ
jgi:hypothetical protein